MRVANVELEAGERVLVWSEATNHGKQRAVMIACGALLAPLLIGLVLLYKVFTYRSWAIYTELVTDRRFVTVTGAGRVTSVPYDTVTKVTTVRQNRIVKWINIQSTAAKAINMSVTTVGAPSVALPDFLTRRGDPAFLASIAPVGRAASL